MAETDFDGREVLVTGGTGFIGQHLVRALVAAGARVRALVRPDSPRRDCLVDKYAKDSLRVVPGDVTHADSLRDAMHGVRIVYHLAAVVSDWAPPRRFSEVTVEGTRKLCEASLAAGVGRFVEVSTNDVFGLMEDLIIDETVEFRPWGEPYPDSKIAAAETVEQYRKRGLPAVSLYPCWVHGAGDRSFVPALAEAMRRGSLPLWRRDPLVWPTFVDNLIDILLLAGIHPEAAGGFLVHDGESLTLEEFASLIAAAVGAKPPSSYMPYWIAMLAARGMEGLWRVLRLETRPLLTTYAVKNLGSRLRFSIRRAERVLGWIPPVPCREGISRTLEQLAAQDSRT